MSLWNEKTAVEATQGKAQGAAWVATRVEIDSRKIQKGDLFVALKGDKFDGHDYVADAIGKGAVAALVSRVPANAASMPLLIVSDVQKGLENLARFARKRSRAQIVGVTGSVGKTSAKEMLRLGLSAFGNVFATSGNYNNHIGTPLNLANLPPHLQFAVFEMGMNHAGEISHLTNLVQPHIAVITNVEAVHMEFFPSLEAIADAKSEIFEGVVQGGAAVLNRDSPLFTHMEKNAAKRGIKKFFSFGTVGSATCRLAEYRATANGSHVVASIQGKRLDYDLKAIGRHWATTSLLVLAVAEALSIDVMRVSKMLAEFQELEGRGRVMPVNVGGIQILLIDDSYNASPAAMKAAFAKTAEVWLGGGKKGRKIAALGDMLELGNQGPALHSSLAADLEKQGFDSVFTAGALMQNLTNALPAGMRGGQAATAADLLPLLTKQLRSGDIVLVKGSHGSKMYELAQALKTPIPQGEKKNAV